MKEATEEDWINKLTILANTVSIPLGNFAQRTRTMRSEQSSNLSNNLERNSTEKPLFVLIRS